MIRFLNNRAGVALLLVLWVLVMLSVIAAEFSRAMRTEVTIARNDKDATQAYYAAIGGLNLAIYHTLETISRPMAKPASVLGAESAGNEIDWRINTDIGPLDIGAQGLAQVRIDNEAGRVNINLADQSLLRAMLTGLPISDEEKDIIASSMIDWRDPDDLHQVNGAENDYYRALAEPYACKNSDFETKEELLRVRGVTPTLFHEHLKYMVTVYPDQQTAKRLLHWRTIDKRSATAFDFNKININAASPKLLGALPGFSPEAVEAIAAYRAQQDLRTTFEIMTVVGEKAFVAANNLFTFKLSPYYRVSARGGLNDSPAAQGVTAMLFVDTQREEKYRIIQWTDHLDRDRAGT